MITKKWQVTLNYWIWMNVFNLYLHHFLQCWETIQINKENYNKRNTLTQNEKRENEAAAHLSPALWLWCGSAAQESGSCHPTGGRQRSQQRLLQDDRCEGNVTGSCPKPAESSSSLLIQTPSLCLPEEQQTTWLKATVHPEMKTCAEQI